MNVGPVNFEQKIDCVFLGTWRNRCVLMAVILALWMVESFQMGIDLQMLPDLESKRFSSKLKLVNVAIMIDRSLFNNLKLRLDCFAFRHLFHYICQRFMIDEISKI